MAGYEAVRVRVNEKWVEFLDPFTLTDDPEKAGWFSKDKVDEVLARVRFAVGNDFEGYVQ